MYYHKFVGKQFTVSTCPGWLSQRAPYHLQAICAQTIKVLLPFMIYGVGHKSFQSQAYFIIPYCSHYSPEIKDEISCLNLPRLCLNLPRPCRNLPRAVSTYPGSITIFKHLL